MLKGRLLLLLAVLVLPATSYAVVFQWTDANGTIHFTDDEHKVPSEIKKTGGVITRTDLTAETPPPSAEAPRPETPESHIVERQAEPPPAVQYSPTQIVVENSLQTQVRAGRCRHPQACGREFRPSFNDRRYIHPSVFDRPPKTHSRSRSGRARK